MTARRPIDGAHLTRQTQSQKQIEKAKKVRENFVNIFDPPIKKFVRLSYEKEMGSPAERVAEDRAIYLQIMNSFESEEMQKEIAESQGEKKFSEALSQGLKNIAGQTDEEFIEQSMEIDEDLILRYSRESSNAVWTIMMSAAIRLFEESGPQSMDVEEFLSKLNFAGYLANSFILEEHYPEIKAVLAAFMPQLLKDSFMNPMGDGKYLEVAYLELSKKIVLREVNWETVQTWAHS